MAAIEKEGDPIYVAGADRLMNKYLAVWLWSVLFGSNVSVVFSLMNLGAAAMWKQLGLVLLIPGAAGALFAIYALVMLYRAMTQYLLPRFFGYWADRKIPPETEADPKRFAYLLHRAFSSLVVAAACRLITALTDLILGALSGSGRPF